MQTPDLLEQATSLMGQVVTLEGVIVSDSLDVWVARGMPERHAQSQAVILLHPNLFTRLAGVSLLVGGDVAFALEGQVTGRLCTASRFASGIGLADISELVVVREGQRVHIDLTGHGPTLVIAD